MRGTKDVGTVSSAGDGCTGGGQACPGRTGSVIAAASGVVLRYARDDDAAAIIGLIAAIWAEYPGKMLNAPADMPELLAPATAYAEANGRFWVIEARGELLGTVALKPNAHDPTIVELQKMYVARAVRHNGLGTFLCRLVEREARARGARAIELWSDIKLHDAHRHYRRCGFVRGPELRFLADASRTVQHYYRMELDGAAIEDASAAPAATWQMLVQSWAARGATFAQPPGEPRA